MVCWRACVALFLFFAADLDKRAQSALQVWGIPMWLDDQDIVVEDADKEAFSAHVDSMFTDML